MRTPDEYDRHTEKHFLRSLRVRLLLMFLLVAFVAIGAVALFASQATNNGFQHYLNNEQDSDGQLIAQIVMTYQQHPTQVQALITQTARSSGSRILLIDNNQRVVADSDAQLTGQTLTVTQLMALQQNQQPASSGGPPTGSPPPMHTPIKIISTRGNGMSFGPSPLSSGQGGGAPGNDFLNSVNRSLLLASIVAGAAVLVLTLLLSNTLLKPIRALTLAARRMEHGDLSQRVAIKSKDEIGELAHAFNTMAESVQHSEQLRRNMVSDVAHELRTPLTNIRGYLEALQDGVVAPDTMVIASLYEEAELLSLLVKDLQDLTLAEAGQLQMHREPVVLEDIVANAVNGLAPQANNRHSSVSIDIPADLPLVEADPQRVGQILRNLLSNALKHTPSEGKVCVSAHTTGQEVEVCVQDTGVGIEAEHLPHLFKRFYRADASRARATGGTGLGLAIVEQLVQAHGGHVSVESEVGKGTQFTFTLPVADV